jgi:hypothetical protein
MSVPRKSVGSNIMQESSTSIILVPCHFVLSSPFISIFPQQSYNKFWNMPIEFGWAFPSFIMIKHYEWNWWCFNRAKRIIKELKRKWLVLVMKHDHILIKI